MNPNFVHVRGVIHQRRKLGRQLLFIMISPTASSLSLPQGEIEAVVTQTIISNHALPSSIAELIVRENAYSMLLDLSNKDNLLLALYELRLGDEVQVFGILEDTSGDNPICIRATYLQILTRWIDIHGNAMSFIPPTKYFLTESQISRIITQQADSKQAKPSGSCKFWMNSLRCNKGEFCKFFHSTGEALAKERREWMASKKLRREKKLSEPVDDEASHGSKARREERAQVFCSWLINTYGIEYHNSFRKRSC